MTVVISLWILAMIGGLCWGYGVVWVATGATVLSGLVWLPGLVTHVWGWVLLMALGCMPLWLAAWRHHALRRIKRLQAREALKLTRVQETTRATLAVQAGNQRVEMQIGHMTELYHVTRETAPALRVDELLMASLKVLPELLEVSGLRLIDCPAEPASTDPVVWRARTAAAGGPSVAAAEPLSPSEVHVLERARKTGLAGVLARDEVADEWPAGVTHLAWAPLWSEREPVGVLIGENLPEAQLGIFSVIANQLSLQLARIHLYQAVEAMAVTDTLTGLAVRRYFLELATDELQRAKRHQLPCAFLMVDLDHFKQKNDTYGHLVGDVILRDVAQLLKRHLRGVDLIARYGGEEFVLLLVETGADTAMAVAERLRQLVELCPMRAYDETLHQTISIGVAMFPGDGQELQTLMDRADEALYRAKRTGRNRVVRWSKDLNAEAPDADHESRIANQPS